MLLWTMQSKRLKSTAADVHYALLLYVNDIIDVKPDDAACMNKQKRYTKLSLTSEDSYYTSMVILMVCIQPDALKGSV